MKKPFQTLFVKKQVTMDTIKNYLFKEFCYRN